VNDDNDDDGEEYKVTGEKKDVSEKRESFDALNASSELQGKKEFFLIL
jgi:hypothetical protein